MTYYTVPDSGTNAIVTIDDSSNIGVPGRWVFRTDSANVEGLECTDSGVCRISMHLL